MCGRYFWTDDAQEEFEEDFPLLAGEIRKLRAGDYTPAMTAIAVTAADHRKTSGDLSVHGDIGAGSDPGVLSARQLQWGFPGFDKGKLLINARAESVKDRPTFADSYAQRRCVLPAAGFYEWDRKKEKVIFTLPDKPLLYLAGIFRPYGPEMRFVILTREANASMAPVHDRMPLILSNSEVEPWISDAAEADRLLAKQLPALKAQRPFEQISFDW